mmetsp:Transcript_25332/g.55031  ORF Transcript_25332/g.55031 Transcript_25332/m.55031 type:complete len:572 (+) Transcript_25332:136-1851(+)|eukprot:CAMPEP_0202893774 /NCGR_PEP_ID=MMETSP1392-20130828/3285_1 /ASSEMBLY_ACC=CAM_ASM_000868 /TAXON_ID=225041 /ORGANISM="Chlamydomonas chlamydogama, Strain SAG 11-48b" /LENGTH=571 /DNA_ID=CAMNT_0049578223 /DNA_START=118 /DNA_END=1833 /DNA_ORIENTATION=-
MIFKFSVAAMLLAGLVLCHSAASNAILQQGSAGHTTIASDRFEGTLMVRDALNDRNEDVQLYSLVCTVDTYELNLGETNRNGPLIDGARVRVLAKLLGKTLLVERIDLVDMPVENVRGRSLQQSRFPVKTTFRLVVFIMDLTSCKGVGPATTTEEVRRAITSDRQNFADYMSTCSNGAAEIDRASLKIVTIPYLACSGVTTLGQAWTLNSCQGASPWGWFDYAEQQAPRLGINLDLYTHRVIITPRNQGSVLDPGCAWAGLSTNGLVYGRGNPFGYLWINGDFVNSPLAWMHELGHTFGFQQHAAKLNDCESCDTTSAMGGFGGGGLRCFNAPHNWALGWSAELNPGLSVASMPVGTVTNYQLLNQFNTALPSILRIQGGSAAGGPVFLSLRSNFGEYERPFDALNDRPTVLLHTWDAVSATDFKQARQTMLQTSFYAAGNSWSEPATGLVVKLVSITTAAATVSVCRASEYTREVSCFDGLDNDCDGLPDALDPDCMGGVTPWQAPQQKTQGTIDFSGILAGGNTAVTNPGTNAGIILGGSSLNGMPPPPPAAIKWGRRLRGTSSDKSAK